VRTATLKVGHLGYWHTVHILLSLVTAGGWLIVYALHAIIATVTRPTVTVDVPDGARVEYRDGYPNVLLPDEYLEPRPRAQRLMIVVACLVPLVTAGIVVVGAWRLA
jgi:hypothetical protein